MSTNTRLLKNTALITVAQVSAQAVNFFFLPLYTAVLTTEEYGIVDLYSVLRTVLSYVIFLGIEHAVFTFCISSSDEKTKREYFSIGVLLASIALIIFSIIYVIMGMFFHITHYGMLYVYFVSFAVFMFVMNMARALEELKLYAVGTASSTVLTVLFNLIFVILMKLGVRGILVSGILAYFSITAYILIRLQLQKMIIPYWNIHKIKEMLRYSLPLVLNNTMSWVATSSDRIIISVLLGSSINGIYSLANKFYMIITVLGNGFQMAWSEVALKVLHKPNYKEYYYKMLHLVMDIYFLMISALIVILPWIFTYFINASYHDAYNQIPIIVYATLWWGMAGTMGWISLAHKKSGEIGIGTLLVGIINVSIHLLLIQRIGLYAASVSTLISYISLFLFRYIIMYRLEKIRLSSKKIVFQIVIYMILCVCYYKQTLIYQCLALVIYIICVITFVNANKMEILLLIKSGHAKIQRRKG